MTDLLSMAEAMAKIKKLSKLLEISVCPAECDQGEWYGSLGEAVQCQFCDERDQLLKDGK